MASYFEDMVFVLIAMFFYLLGMCNVDNCQVRCIDISA